ncbi:MAG: hypothetical protein MUC95_06880 [Spirochaetes bacterium]|nr:hypothetical protein [Spirochaetota bacterium]
MKISFKLYKYILPAVFVIAISQGETHSQFLLDNEDSSSSPKEETQPLPAKETRELPVDAARNIRAELVPDIRGAIKITWSVHTESKDDYIVGRTYEVPDKLEKALKALSIKVVPAGSTPEVIDSNLAPGSYYYCIISKKKILERDIELFPNMNYTVSPVIIEQEVVKTERTLPQQVSLIYARKMNENRVLITWRGIEMLNVVYTVYRSSSQLDSPDKIRNAEIITRITDGRESYVDKNVNQSGVYYYAITTRDIMGNEDMSLIADQSYTTSGIVISAGGFGSVVDIMAVPVENNSVKITWNTEGAGVSAFVVYRYSKPISDNDRLALAVYLETIRANEMLFIDKNPGSGACFYAVLAKLDTGKVNDKLVMAENFTVNPVVIGKQVSVLSIVSKRKGDDVELVWKFEGSAGNRNFKILRSSSKFKSFDDLDKGFVVDYVDIFNQSYIDKNPPSGEFYYAIIPQYYHDEKNFELASGVNITQDPVIIEKNVRKPESRIITKKPVKEYELDMIVKPQEPEVFKAKKPVILTELDAILESYFFNEKYEIALEQLKEFVDRSDNDYEISKARLFIGRCLVEQGKYREAVDFLILPDVKANFPDESEFWAQYAVGRIQ